MKILGYALFFAAALGIVVWSTYAKYQEGIGIIHYLQQHGLDLPAAIGIGIGLLYLVYAWFFKGKPHDHGDTR